MSRKGFIGLGLALVVIIVIGIIAYVALGNNSNQSSINGFEKGAQITAFPAPQTPLPTGPTQPTPLPGSTPVPPTPLPPTATAVPATVASSTATIAPTLVPATATPTPKPANYLIPNKIQIPSINVNTFVERVGVTKDGLMDVPKNIWNTAWFGNGGYRPGDLGNAVIDGHLDAPGTEAVFWNLDKLKVGDKVILTDAGGKQMTFQVVDTQVYGFDSAPLAQIFGPSTEARLNLITCGGTYDRTSQNYNKRLVVYTKLVNPA